MESPQRRFISSFEELLCLVVSREFLAILTIKRVSETKACFRCRVSDDSKVFIARSIRRTTLEKNRTVTFFTQGLQLSSRATTRDPGITNIHSPLYETTGT